jgi:hypothetical protein
MTQPADAACQLLQVGELQVAMSGNSPMIPASMNGQAVQLLADTGAAKSVIWRSAAQELKLQIIQSDTRFYGAGGADTAMAHRIYVARSQGKIYFTYKGGPIFQHVEPNAPAPSGEAGAAEATPQ